MSDTQTNQFNGSGTTAERLAFTPNPATVASGPDQGYTFWDTDLQAAYAWDTGTADWVAIGGGGGSATETTAIGSETLTTAGDLDFYTDAPYVARYTGAAWSPWGPVWPLTLPDASAYAWVNQGTATISTTTIDGPLYLAGSFSASGNASWALRVKTLPAAPYTITTAAFYRVLNVNFSLASVGWRESGSGKIIDVGVDQNGRIAGANKWNSPTSYNSTYAATMRVPGYGWVGGVVWIRLKDDNTNRSAQFSHDGLNWVDLIAPVSRTDFMTPDEAFFGVNDSQNTFANAVSAITLISWLEQ